MNKKEQQQLADAIEAAELNKALRWTDEVSPDIPPPKSGYTTGWLAFGTTGRVERGWSDSVSHGYGPAPINSGIPRNGRQNSCWLFSSPERAMRHIRNRIEQEAAQRLLEIDKRIKKAQQ